MQSRYTTAVDVRREPDPTPGQVTLRLSDDAQNELLRVLLPAAIGPSAVGLGDFVGAAGTVPEFQARLDELPDDTRPVFRLFEEEDDDSVICRIADMRNVVRAIWSEALRTCAERQLTATRVGLR